MGGEDIQRNISLVPRYKHEDWHKLFDNFPAIMVLERFQFFYETFGIDWHMSNEQRKIANRWIRNKKPRIKKRLAWFDLFTGRSLEKIINEINKVWIDPDYEFIIGYERVKKVKMVTKSSTNNK